MLSIQSKIPDSGSQRGFTLVETMVVLALALILLTAGVPIFNQIIKNNRLVAQANALSGLMASARSEAITQRAVVTVCGSSNGTACDGQWSAGWISFLDVNGNAAVNTGDGDVVLKRVNSVPDTINVAFVGATTVRFNSQGFAVAGSSGTMRFCDERGDTYGRALNISATGRVSVATDTDSSPDGIVDDAAGTNIDCP
ncbi:MAG: GspH/FimT family pseudopilin [Gammaproteobacteria bacterium]|nr:GspH/FimT family pseudopilin [Gammaproteobacteria bacterium]